MKAQDILLIGGLGLAALYILNQRKDDEGGYSGGIIAIPGEGMDLSWLGGLLGGISMPDLGGYFGNITAGLNGIAGVVQSQGGAITDLIDRVAAQGSIIDSLLAKLAGMNQAVTETANKITEGAEKVTDTINTVKETKERITSETQKAAFSWADLVAGWQGGATERGQGVKLGNLGSATKRVIESKGLEVQKGAWPWQTPRGEGFVAPWNTVVRNASGYVLTENQLYKVLMAPASESSRPTAQETIGMAGAYGVAPEKAIAASESFPSPGSESYTPFTQALERAGIKIDSKGNVSFGTPAPVYPQKVDPQDYRSYLLTPAAQKVYPNPKTPTPAKLGGHEVIE